jgi:hypothetical protein
MADEETNIRRPYAELGLVWLQDLGASRSTVRGRIQGVVGSTRCLG